MIALRFMFFFSLKIFTGGKTCPSSQELQEYRLCNDHSCTQLYWETSAWGSCSENTLVTALNVTIGWNGEATCGVGIQTRKVFCIKSHVGQVMTKRYHQPSAECSYDHFPCIISKKLYKTTGRHRFMVG